MTYAINQDVIALAEAFGSDQGDQDVKIAAAEQKAEAALPFASRADATAATIYAPVVAFDVGGLRYVRDPAGTALETADGAKWSPAGEITPQHFGAVQNDVTDDAPAINEMLDWAAGREVIIPNRTGLPYYCASTLMIPSGTTIRAEGTQYAVNNAGDALAAIRSTASVAVAMRAGELDTGNSRGILLERLKVIVTEDGAVAFSFKASKMCHLIACLAVLQGPNQVAFRMTAGKTGRTFGGCFYNTLDGCKVVGHNDTGIGLLCEGEVDNGQCNANQFIGCSFEFLDKGIVIGPGLGNRFTDCIIEDCATRAITFQSGAWRNVVSNLYTEGVTPVVGFEAGSSENTVTVTTRSNGQTLTDINSGTRNRASETWAGALTRQVVDPSGAITPNLALGNHIHIPATGDVVVNDPTSRRNGDLLIVDFVSAAGGHKFSFRTNAFRVDNNDFPTTGTDGGGNFRGLTSLAGMRHQVQFVYSPDAGRWSQMGRMSVVSAT